MKLEDNQVTATILGDDIHSTQDWTRDPDAAWVGIPLSLWKQIPGHLSTMQKNRVASMTFSHRIGYEFYEACDEDDNEIVLEHEGVEYSIFTPSYPIDSPDLVLSRDGELKVVFHFKHTPDELWFDIGCYDPNLVPQEAPNEANILHLPSCAGHGEYELYAKAPDGMPAEEALRVANAEIKRANDEDLRNGELGKSGCDDGLCVEDSIKTALTKLGFAFFKPIMTHCWDEVVR